MKWEKILIVICFGFVAGIALAYGLQDSGNGYPLLLAVSGIIAAAAAGWGFLQFSKYQYYPVRFRNIAIFALGVFLAVLNFMWRDAIPAENHISQFARFKPQQQVVIEGLVSNEPTIQRDKTNFRLRAETIEIGDKKIDLIGKGKVEVYIYPDNKYYGKVYYGDRFRVKGGLIKPKPAENPGGFDYQKFLKSNKIFAQMFIRNSNDMVKTGHRRPNPLITFALRLKQNMLSTIRKTMPYPESAFLGGVTLGLRYGIRKTYLKGSDVLIEDEFKWSGVNHVLAVSGLHVTIITIMFWGIFTMIKIPRKIFPFIIIFFLLLFTIITGARPSTVRAAIMNSLILMTYALTKSGLRASILTGVAVAAALILFFQPRMIVEASFTLSFGAVLSLVLLTPPIMEILNTKLIGYRFLAGIGIVIVFTAMVIILQNKFFNIFMIGLFLLIAITIWIAGSKLQKSNPMLGFSFRRIPRWLGGFIGAQFAIQLGMMLPLSAYYFGRYPVAGAYANFIAIPLIGVNVQLGILAGVFGLIPKIGIYAALLINAGNWLFCKLFLWLAHVATLIFPYPHVIKPTGPALVIYYLLIAGFVWKDFLIGNIKKYYFNLVVDYKDHPRKYKKLTWAAVLMVVLIIAGVFILVQPEEKPLQVVFYSVGYSNAAFIRTPDNTNILVDAGLHYKYFRDGIPHEWDVAEKQIIPSLLNMRIKRIDYMVVTNLNRENISGVHSIIEHMDVKYVLLPLDIEIFHSELTYDRFLDLIKNDYYKKNKDKWWVQEYYDQYISLLKLIEEKNIPHRQLKFGEYVVHEYYKADDMIKEFELYSIAPRDIEFTGRKDELSDKSIVLYLKYGIKPEKNSEKYLKKNSFLIMSDVGKSVQTELIEDNLVSETDIITVPAKGNSRGLSREFLDTVKPLEAVLQFSGFGSNQWREDNLRDIIIPEYEKRNIEIFNTDKYGAVMYSSDGNKLERKVMIEKQEN